MVIVEGPFMAERAALWLSAVRELQFHTFMPNYVIGLLGQQGPAAILGQHCPYMTYRLGR